LHSTIDNSYMSACEICIFKKLKFFHKINKYRYYLCPNCQTLFLVPKPTVSQITKYYKKSFEYTAGETNEKEIRKRAKIILKNFKRLNPNGKTLLDIGSGYGYFLDEARNFEYEIHGVEPSKTLYSTSIKRLIEVVITNMNFENYFSMYKLKKFDFITIIHTVEHVLNPKQTLHKAIGLLNPGGILYIETPNVDSHLFRSEKYNYTFLTPPDHIWLFSKKSFKKMLGNNSGIRIERISSYSYPEHFMGILKRNFKYQISSIKSGKKIRKKTFSNLENLDLGFVWKLEIGNWKFFKYLLLDRIISPILTPFLNLGIYGSILELYIRKK